MLCILGFIPGGCTTETKRGSRVVIGLNPSERTENVSRNARILDSLIERRTGIDVEVFIAHDYSGLVEAMRGGTIDLAFFAPVSYVFAERIAGAQVLLKAERRGQSYYYGCIIVNADSGIRSLEELRGRDIAWVDPTSASGHIFPKAGLVERGIDPDTYFGRQTFAGGHDAVLLSVVNGTVTAGATYANDTAGVDGSWTQLGDGSLARHVRPIYFSRPIPGDNLAASRKAMDEMPEVVERIRRGVLALGGDSAGRRLMHDLYHVDAMVPATSADYDPVRTAAELLDLDIAGRIASGSRGRDRAEAARRQEERNATISIVVLAAGVLVAVMWVVVHGRRRDRPHRAPPLPAHDIEQPARDAQISARGLTVRFEREGMGTFAALNKVSVDIRHGEFVGIIGLSGAGKSTLLRTLNGSIHPTEGSVWFEGTDLANASRRVLADARRHIGFVFQQFNLLKNLTAMHNVLTGRLGHRRGPLSIIGLFPLSDKMLAHDLIAEMGLTEQAHQRVDRMSGGQQQRVAIARALAQEPTVILADEPMASLDPRLSEVVLDFLTKINRDRGITIVVNLHVLELARSYASRIIALREGSIVYDGPTAELDDDSVTAIYSHA